MDDAKNDLLDADTIPCGLLALGDDGVILAANTEIAVLVGIATRDLAGHYIDDLFTAAARLLYHTYVFPLLKLHGHVEEIETSLRDCGGQRVDIVLNARRQTGAGAPVIRCVVQRQRQRRRLEDQLLGTRLAAQHLPGVMFQLLEDSDGKQSLPFASEAVRKFFGVAPADLHRDAQPLWAAVHPDDRTALRESLRTSAQSATEWRCKFRASSDGATRWLEVHAAPQRRSDTTTLWHGYIADITEQYEREQALIEKESAQRANRSKSEFLARMSHELRTPLNSILGFARLLDLDLRNTLNPGQLQKLHSIENSGRDLLYLINEILDISRIEAGQTRMDIGNVALHPLLQKITQQMEPSATAAGIALDMSVPDDLIARADPQRLQQILVNLLSNAIKYNRAHGKASLRAFQLDDGVRIEVQDEGPGLSAEQLSELFQPFNRLGAERSAIEGTGLGLVIAHALIEQMHGRMDICSTVGKGSNFAIELPRGNDGVEPAAEPRPLLQAAVAVPAGVQRVLCVEDNPVNVLLMESLFGLRPWYQLTVATDAESALRTIAERPPQLLLIDMHLPDATGAELLAAIRATAHGADIPAVAVSADAMPEDIEAALRAGFYDYWTKPLNIDLALQALDRLLSAAPAMAPLAIQQAQAQQQ